MTPADSPRRVLGLAFSAAVILCTVLAFYSSDHITLRQCVARPITTQTAQELPAFRETLEYFIDYPIRSPFKDGFGELGRRSRVLRDWLVMADNMPKTAPTRAVLEEASEEVALSLFPFLANYKSPWKGRTIGRRTPVSDIRASFSDSSAGIVIPAGDKNALFAAHLIGSLRTVLKSTLPIQIAYAGDADLSKANRNLLAGVVNDSLPIEFLDVSTVFQQDNDDITKIYKAEGGEPTKEGEEKPLKRESLHAPFFRFLDRSSGGGWAFKSFAALATRFEKVILLDADAVFVQPPESLLAQEDFNRTGALLFHDRLLWKNAFPARHEWWHDQIRRPSAELSKSLVWSEQYAEEGDSGVVVLDKGRVDVLVGLLHTCWQNTYAVRQEVTYKILYGDKESWWMGLELAGSSYTMEEHYGAMVGWATTDPIKEDESGGTNGTDSKTVENPKPTKVCSFVIAHMDKSKRLLWYNGSLRKNKAHLNDVEYEVPRQWMLDGDWEKGAQKMDMSCMRGAPIHDLTTEEVAILQRSIDLAQMVDLAFTS
ncbi:glycosyl transferase [Grosmannia clavigera kw1407]|uniref:Glycosyl transferase n=1 Tax=Grosmannia clavigera (strain kw1407 / UAMH 11150) TaxID=655863 RepID=F0XN52_GROCL|nr:glycosyl transferase [Grosmannia clavigera kw1407]EFX00958.1 glycosyl transferase [Grosmannia clavigera kw1407]